MALNVALSSSGVVLTIPTARCWAERICSRVITPGNLGREGRQDQALVVADQLGRGKDAAVTCFKVAGTFQWSAQRTLQNRLEDQLGIVGSAVRTQVLGSATVNYARMIWVI